MQNVFGFNILIKNELKNIKNLLVNQQNNRYQNFDRSENYLLTAENMLSKYIDKKYCLGVNSGGMAITLSLIAIKKLYNLLDNSIVFSNSFTFNAVPSAIVNANFKPVFVETDKHLLIDLDDLELKIQKYKCKKNVLVLSYMRGRIPNMDKVLKLCNKYNIIMLEDAAHAYGCMWNKKK
jgi:dTDP-4-amino-4,6-dideoxygalactose transaminase|tara:strand:+ start:3065 stop:3601 length:537 start_codon:yes stop_codon:yes gene_type:complete